MITGPMLDNVVT